MNKGLEKIQTRKAMDDFELLQWMEGGNEPKIHELLNDNHRIGLFTSEHEAVNALSLSEVQEHYKQLVRFMTEVTNLLARGEVDDWSCGMALELAGEHMAWILERLGMPDYICEPWET